MLFGRNFAWAHIGKTGGDAAVVLFCQIPDLVVQVDDLSNPCKHHPFRRNNLDLQSYRYWLLNIRRLPSWVISFVQEIRNHHEKSFPIPSSRLLSEARLPDRLLADYTDNSRYPIHRWLRMEHLRQDIAEFVDQEIRPLSVGERNLLSTCPTKAGQPYDHRFEHWFTRRDCEKLYRNNPLWASIEQKAYGNLLLDYGVEGSDEKCPAVGAKTAFEAASAADGPSVEDIEKALLYGLIHATGPCKVCPCC